MRFRLALPVAAALALSAAALAAGTLVVDPAHLQGWTATHDHCSAATSTGSQGFVNGPATPPAGVGSYQFTIGSNGDSYETFSRTDLAGKRLTDLSELSYHTYVSHFGSGGQAPYIDLTVDWNNNGTQNDTLTFEPVYQTGAFSGDPVPNQGALALNTWQRWDAKVGGWWSDQAGTSGPPLVTLAHYQALHPDAKILNVGQGGFRLATGCGAAAWVNFVGNADKVTIGVSSDSTTYDLEPAAAPPPPTGGTHPKSKADCKKGGWKRFTDPSFKNQGRCIAWVNHHVRGKGKHHK
jgi:hypothetical protein